MIPSDDDFRNNNDTNSLRSEETKGQVSSVIKKNALSISDSFTQRPSPELSSMTRRFRKISVDKLTSLGGAMHAAMARRRKSVATEQPVLRVHQEKKFDWKSPVSSTSSSPRLMKKAHSTESESTLTDHRDIEFTKEVSSSPVCSSSLNSSSFASTPPSDVMHKGFLELRNKKKRWEKCWCVLQKACIYCYNSPQSQKTRDVIFLRDYAMMADVKSLNRVRYIFHLQQQGSPNIYFSCDNYQDYLLWVGCLEKEITSLSSKSTSRKLSGKSEDLLLTKQTKKFSTLKQQRASLPNIHQLPLTISREVKTPNEMSSRMSDHEFVSMQKQKLLKELEMQKKVLLEEQRLLERLPGSPKSRGNSKSPQLSKISRKQLNYRKQRSQEELRVNNSEGGLDRRRSSCSLKRSSLITETRNTVEIRENHRKFHEMENKLKEMKRSLSVIETEIRADKLESEKNFNRLEEKKNLELQIFEHQEAIANIRDKREKRMQRRRSFDAAITSPISKNSDSSLRIMNRSLTPAKIMIYNNEMKIPSSLNRVEPVLSNQLKMSFYLGDADDDITTDEDSGIQASYERLIEDGDCSRYLSSSFNGNSISRKQSRNGRSVQETNLYQDDQESSIFASSSSSSSSHTSYIRDDEIDPVVLAKIEDFEIFAQEKLEEVQKHPRR